MLTIHQHRSQQVHTHEDDIEPVSLPSVRPKLLSEGHDAMYAMLASSPRYAGSDQPIDPSTPVGVMLSRRGAAHSK